jgi:hypothetical protein
MAVTIGDVTIRIGASTKTLNQDLRKAERSLQASAAKFKNIGQSLSLGVTAPLAFAGAAAFKMASDFDESLNKVRVAFGDSALEIEAFAKKTLQASGIAEGSALDMAAYFGDMATSMGITQGTAADMSQQLVMLAGDLASFKNIDIKQAQTALAGVFTGETESLKQLGVVMTETNLAAFALTQGITKNIKTMSQAEKTNLRFAFVLDSTKNAQGDFARTSDGAANQMRIFQESVKQLSAQFGKTLLPLLTPLINRLNGLIERFSNLSQGSKNLIVTLAAVAAALGPILYGVGLLINAYTAAIIPIVRLTAGFAAQRIAAEAAGKAALTAGQYAAASFRTALAAAGPYLIAIGAIAFAAYQLYQNLQTSNKEKQKAKSLDEIAIENTQKERDKIQSLIGVIKSETAEKNTKKKALEEIKKIAPGYFADLNTEKISIDKLNTAYAEYSKNILANAKALAARKKINELAAELLDIQEKTLKTEETKVNASGEAKKLAAIGGSAAQVAEQEKIALNLSNAILETYSKREKEIEKQIELYTKFAATEDDLNNDNNDNNTNLESLTEQLKKLDVELTNIQRQFQAGLISSQEASAQRADVLKKKLELLVNAGFNPTSDAVVKLKNEINDLNNLQPLAKLEVPNLADKFKQALEGFKSAEGTTDILSSLTNLEKFQSNLNAATKQAAETTKKNLAEGLKGKVTFQTSAYQEWFNEFNNELSDIQLKTDSGLITSIQGDVEKLDFLTQALNNLKGQGLGEGNIKFDTVQGEIDKIGFGPKFLKGAQDTISTITEYITPVVEQIGSLFSQIFANRSAELDAYYEKERAYIEGSTISEEAKAAKIKALDEDLAKKKRALARKQAIADKAAAIFSALVNGATAVIKALNAGPVLGPLLAKVTAGLVAAQVAAIAATPLPSLAIGTDKVKSDGLAMLHKGEAIVPANVVGGGFTGGGMLNVSGRIQGTDILLVSDYAMDFKTRIR